VTYIAMSDLAQFALSQTQACEPGEGFWGFRLTAGPGENGWRVVDLVPFVGALVGALPGLSMRDGTWIAVVGGAIGLVAGSTAWMFLPPHRNIFASDADRASHETACSGGIFG